jgi:MFS transporter, UMF1 family
MKTSPKVQNAWAFYDWANSTYNLVIGTAIFPLFFGGITTRKDEFGKLISDEVDFFGFQVHNTQVYSYCLALGMLLVCLITPTLAGIADYLGRKKWFLQFFCYLGSAACVSLFFFDPDHLEWSMISVVLASLGFWCSYAFANSFLPEIAEPHEQDKLSARGFSMGYAGSVLLLLINLGFIMGVAEHKQELFTRLAFVSVGLWWAGFAQYTFRHLPERVKPNKFRSGLVGNGFRELKKVWKDLRETKRLKRYLISFFVFSMGVQTIMQMAQFFGQKEVIRVDSAGHEMTGLSTPQLIIAIIFVQLIAIPGAIVFSKSSKRLGNLQVLRIALLIWVGVCCFAYFFVRTPLTFFIAAALIGFVMGGTQSLARSTYSKFLPETDDHASYFSFFDVTEKVGLIIGLFSFGLIEGLAGSLRSSVLALIAFFVIGVLLLLIVPEKESRMVREEFRG